MTEKMEMTHRDVRIHVSGDVAFCTCLGHMGSTFRGGGQADMWVRVTVGYRKREGRWRVVHEHVSVPFDPQSHQALTNLNGDSANA